MSAAGMPVEKNAAFPRALWLLLALTLGMLYAVTFDTGVISSKVADSGLYLHELFHDGRHLLGAPCH